MTQEATACPSLTVWATDEAPDLSEERVCLWQAVLPAEAPSGWASLPDLVESDWERSRSMYWAWLEDLSLLSIKSQTVVQVLRVSPSMSAWWWGLPSEYPLAPDSTPYRLVRLLLFDELFRKHPPKVLQLVGGNYILAKAFETWCQECNVQFKWKRRHRDFLRAKVQRKLVLLAAALRFFLFLAKRPTPKRRLPNTLIQTYADSRRETNNDVSGGQERYWGQLDKFLSAQDGLGWLYVPTGSNFWQRPIAGKKGHSSGVFLASLAGFREILRASGEYLLFIPRVLRVQRKVGQHLSGGAPHTKEIAKQSILWRLLGPEAVDLFVARQALTSWLGSRKAQRCLYLFENQPWEHVLVDTWKSTQDGPILGVAHSTMLDWDTRYFPGPSALQDEKGLPLPSSILVNGDLMRRSAIRGGYVSSYLRTVEALRFGIMSNRRRENGCPKGIDVLVVGDYSLVMSEKMVSVVNDAFPENFVISFRPHAGSSAGDIDLPAAWLVDQSSSLNEAILDAKLTVCSPYSSASLHALVVGVRPVVLTDGSGFLSDPIHDSRFVTYIASSKELRTLNLNNLLQTPREELLTIDPSYSGWKTVLTNQE